jgi:hypothetical protein
MSHSQHKENALGRDLDGIIKSHVIINIMKNLNFLTNKFFAIVFSMFIYLLIFFSTQASAKIYQNFNECIEKNIFITKSEDNAKALVLLCEKLFPQKIKEINEDEIRQKILLISRLINFMKTEMEIIK